jgi:hypothetical protein
VYGAAGLTRATFIDGKGNVNTGINASRADPFSFDPNKMKEPTFMQILFGRVDWSNPHYDQKFREQFLEAQENATYSQ